jgi:site-specific recombinase XerD
MAASRRNASGRDRFPFRTRHSSSACKRLECKRTCTPVLHARRVKNGTPSTHPLTGRELRALRRLQRESAASPFVFVSERGALFSTAGLGRMIERAAEAAGLDIKAHAHMLRHACGYALANAGHDTRSLQAYLGHRNIQHTVRYTELAPDRFKGFWQD